MSRRQTSVPTQWLIADDRLGDELWPALRKLPRGSGVLYLYRDLEERKRARLLRRVRRIARRRRLRLVDEAAGDAMRVHNMRELRAAAFARVPLVFVSPLFPTRSHPEWLPLNRLQAAALLRLAQAPAIALGGMDKERFRLVEPLGFSGWAGMDAWR